MQGVGSLLMLAVALGGDAFSVAVCVGLAGATTRQKFRLALGFGAFQFLMPVTGLIVGNLLGSLVCSVATYIGGGLLIVLGAVMIWRSLTEGFQCPPLIHKSFLVLVTASLGVSLDALAAGVGFAVGVGKVAIVPASVTIGVVAFLMTTAGAEVGGQVGRLVQHRAPVVGGIILIALGARILLGM